MKKLLSLLSVLTISGTAVPTTIAASPYQKEENNNINYLQENNLEILNRNKRRTYNGYENEIDEGVSPSTRTRNGVFVCFFTPNFFEEITNLKSGITKEDFSIKFKEKFLKESETHVSDSDIKKIGELIYDNFWTIANKFIDSSRKNRIKIKIEKERRWFWGEDWYFKNVEIETDNSNYYQNKFIDNLQRDFSVWNSNEEINLEIIETDNDDNIKNALIKKYPNFQLSNISIVDKKDYSYFTKRFEAKLYVNSNPIYSFGNLRPTLLYITKDKLKEISNKISNNSKVKQWIEHINDWNNDLKNEIKNVDKKTINDKKEWKNRKKEDLKTYIRDWNIILTLIEDELKLNELNKKLQLIESDVNYLKNEIKNINQRVLELEKSNNCESHGYVVSGISSVVALASFPVIGPVSTAVSAISSAVASLCGL